MRPFAILALVTLSAAGCGPKSRPIPAGGSEQENAPIVIAPQCPSGSTYNGVTCVAPAEKIPDPQPVAVDLDAPLDPVDVARDPQAGKRMRPSALLTTELAGLEQLLQATPANAPDRPVLEARLGADYTELARAVAAEHGRAIMIHEAHKKAIQHWEAVVQRTPPYASADEITYSLGYAYEQSGDYASARKTFYALIQKFPSSKYIPHAYAAFGELFFREAAGDPSKYSLAEQAYKEVTKFPNAPPELLGLGYLRLGQVAEKMGDQARAQNNFARVRTDYGSTRAARELH